MCFHYTILSLSQSGKNCDCMGVGNGQVSGGTVDGCSHSAEKSATVYSSIAFPNMPQSNFYTDPLGIMYVYVTCSKLFVEVSSWKRFGCPLQGSK